MALWDFRGCSCPSLQRGHAMQTLGVPYTDEDIANAEAQVEGKTEMDVLVAYLQHLGTAVKNRGQ